MPGQVQQAMATINSSVQSIIDSKFYFGTVDINLVYETGTYTINIPTQPNTDYRILGALVGSGPNYYWVIGSKTTTSFTLMVRMYGDIGLHKFEYVIIKQ